MTNNGLRDETGGLIGGLTVEDYNAGVEDFYAARQAPGITSPSYDLGRQRAAEDQSRHDAVRQWIEDDDRRRDNAMREMLPPEAFKELQVEIAAIRATRRLR